MSKIQQIDNSNIQQEINPYDPLLINNQSNFINEISDDKCIYSNIEKVDEESILCENESNELSSPTNLPNQSQNYIKT